jgi:hypothetical protein
LKIFPNSYSSELELQDAQLFLTFLREKTEGKTGEPKNNCDFIGEFSENEFRVQRKFAHYNGFRPDIVGKAKHGKLKLQIQLNRQAIAFLFVGYLMIGIAFHKMIFPPLVISAIIWTVFWYLGAWALYSVDYKKTRKSLIEIINKTVSNNG